MIGGFIVCWWRGKHLRGKPIRELEWHKGRKFFECPRCHRITSYKTNGATHERSDRILD